MHTQPQEQGTQGSTRQVDMSQAADSSDSCAGREGREIQLDLHLVGALGEDADRHERCLVAGVDGRRQRGCQNSFGGGEEKEEESSKEGGRD